MPGLEIKSPIYIVSKGRWDIPYTANIFLKAKIPFLIAVEPQEYDNYVASIGKEYVLKLPFSNLGLGSYPARNYCWDHAKNNGHKRHFLFDDNIRGFAKLENGKRIFKQDPFLPLLILEFLMDRYINLPLAGYNYTYFVTKSTNKPFFINTHVYSGMLIDNSMPYRWRLKYNEDVDLNLQILHNKQCTLLLNYFLIEKISTVVKLKGGNQSELYKGNDPKKKILKAKSLETIWPQYAKTTMRFNRPHHQISWNKHFKHPLIKKNNYDDIIKEQESVLKNYI